MLQRELRKLIWPFLVPSLALYLVVGLMNAAVAAYIYTLVPEFLMRFIAWLLIHSVYRLRKRGLENIPETGPAVLACGEALGFERGETADGQPVLEIPASASVAGTPSARIAINVSITRISLSVARTACDTRVPMAAMLVLPDPPPRTGTLR